MWRQAPITAAIIIASGLAHHSKLTGMELGLQSVVEVFVGCIVGLIVSWLMSYVWPMRKSPQKAECPPQPAGGASSATATTPSVK
jgi:hypothetical protein